MPAMIDYLNFDIQIEKSNGKHRVKVQGSPTGEGIGEFDVPFSDIELENFFLRIGQPKRDLRRNYQVGSHSKTVQDFGTRLYDAIFQPEVQACFQNSLAEAHLQNKGLRIRLRLTHAPALLTLPWEYLYNPKLKRFLALSRETPLVRYLELPSRTQPLIVNPPLKILVLISCPKGLFQLDVGKEWSTVKAAVETLEKAGLISLDRLEKATLESLQHKLRRTDYNVFHFIGHGTFDDETQNGVLLFEDEHGNPVPVTGGFLGTVLHDCKTLRLAILNACEGARTSKEDPFAGMAQSLIQQDIPATVAMQFEVTDGAAIAFSSEFYRALADGYPVDAALTEVRKLIFGRGNAVEWGTPVLYMRSPDGHIFTVDQSVLGAADTNEQMKGKPNETTIANDISFQKDLPNRRPFASIWLSLFTLLFLIVFISVSGQKILGRLGLYAEPTSSVTPVATWTPTAELPIVSAKISEQGASNPLVAPTNTLASIPTEPPTPIPTPTAQVPQLVTQNPVNVRLGPGTNYPIIGSLQLGVSYTVSGTTVTRDWWQINYDGQDGWVFSQLVTSSNTNVVPIAQKIPPAPTDTPVPPKSTPLPTDTPVLPTSTPSPTATQVSPTDTPTPPYKLIAFESANQSNILNPKLTWFRGVSPQNYYQVVSEETIAIYGGPASGSWGTSFKTPFVSYLYNGDFDVQVKVDFPAQAPDGSSAHLGVIAGTDHWIATGRVYATDIPECSICIDVTMTNQGNSGVMIREAYHESGNEVYLRIVRQGNFMSFYHSDNGDFWIPYYTDLEFEMPDQIAIYLGVAVWNGVGAYAEFSDFKIR